MMLPDSDRAYVDKAKILEYLLSLSHPDGRSKATFFLRFGFTNDQWPVLADALLKVGHSNPVFSVVKSAYGLRYTVDGRLHSPDGRNPRVRTVWIVERSGAGPRLVTAYPI